jgi:branched-chain amino acid transport system substrate-binding protein
VHLAFPTGTNVVASKQNPYLFMMGMTAAVQGYGLGDYLSKLPYTKYYIIGSDYVYGHQLIDYAWGRLTKINNKGTKMGEAWPASGAADFTPYITAILSAKPEAVLAALPGIDDSNFIKQAKGFGYFDKVVHTTVMGLSPSVTVAFGKDMPTGIIGGSNYDSIYCEQKYAEAKAFNAKYNAKAGNYTNVYGDAQEAYDAGRALFAAIQAAGTTAADKLIPVLENVKLATGPRGDAYMLPATHRFVQSCYVGVTTYIPDCKYAVLKDTKEYKGLDFLMSDAEIMAGWKK